MSASISQPDADVGIDVGSMSLALSVDPGVTLLAASYTITGPDFRRKGGLELSEGAASSPSPRSVTFTTVDGLPAGEGYRIDVGATPSDGDSDTCAGAAGFAVTENATTLVSIVLACDEPPPGGTGGATGSAGGAGGRDAGTGGRDAGGATLAPWPGPNAVAVVDQVHQFSANLSGLSYDPAPATGPAVLWAVQNSPSTLYRLLWNGSTWASTTTASWIAGKLLHYPGGTGSPDAEGMTRAEPAAAAVYVASERNNDDGNVSRLSVLRFDTDAVGSALTATNEWNLTADLPVVDANLGLEAIAWVPDTFLVGAGFVDDSTGQPYAPARYANHGTGIFFVGLEANGTIYGYALDHVGGGFHRVATFSGGQVSVMDLSFDRDVGYLWATCDNTCGNRAAVLQLDADPLSPTHGHFGLGRIFDRPSTLPDGNNEGIAIAPESECASGRKSFFWSDDSATGGNSIRRDAIPCGRFF